MKKFLYCLFFLLGNFCIKSQIKNTIDSCPSGMGATSDKKCCPKNRLTNYGHCCQTDELSSGAFCCSSGTLPSNGNCCKPGESFDGRRCCPPGKSSTANNGDGSVCCPAGLFAINNQCFIDY